MAFIDTDSISIRVSQEFLHFYSLGPWNCEFFDNQINTDHSVRRMIKWIENRYNPNEKLKHKYQSVPHSKTFKVLEKLKSINADEIVDIR